jgi:hypothetical protein
MTQNDPLQLHDKPMAHTARAALIAPHPQVERIFQRLTSDSHADSLEVRVLLLVQLTITMYLDLKETFAE